MNISWFHSFGMERSPEKEKRLLAENIFEKRVQQREQRERGSRVENGIDVRHREANTRDKSARVAQESVNNPFGGRAFAPPIDTEYAEQIAKRGLIRFNEGLTKDPQLKRVILKAYALLEMTRAVGEGTVAEFGIDGSGLYVVDMDEDTHANMLREVDAQVKYWNGAPKDVEVEQYPQETNEEYAERKSAIQRYQRSRLDNDPTQRRNLGVDYDVIRGALVTFQRVLDTFKNINENPGRIKTLSLETKKKHPGLYARALTEVAKTDATILEGSEKEFVGFLGKGITKFHGLIEEALQDNPQVIRYYPNRLKKGASIQDGADHFIVTNEDYADMFLSAVKRDGTLLEVAMKEYATVWKEHPEAYANIVATAVEQNPLLFFTLEWNMNEIDLLPSVYDKLSPKTQIELLKYVDSYKAVNRLHLAANTQGGLIECIANALDTEDSDLVLGALGRNKALLQFVKDAQPSLFAEIKTAAGEVTDNATRISITSSLDALTGDVPSKITTESLSNYNPRLDGLFDWKDPAVVRKLLKYLPPGALKKVLADEPALQAVMEVAATDPSFLPLIKSNPKAVATVIGKMTDRYVGIQNEFEALEKGTPERLYASNKLNAVATDIDTVLDLLDRGMIDMLISEHGKKDGEKVLNTIWDVMEARPACCAKISHEGLYYFGLKNRMNKPNSNFIGSVIRYAPLQIVRSLNTAFPDKFDAYVEDFKDGEPTKFAYLKQRISDAMAYSINEPPPPNPRIRANTEPAWNKPSAATSDPSTEPTFLDEAMARLEVERQMKWSDMRAQAQRLPKGLIENQGGLHEFAAFKAFEEYLRSNSIDPKSLLADIAEHTDDMNTNYPTISDSDANQYVLTWDGSADTGHLVCTVK